MPSRVAAQERACAEELSRARQSQRQGNRVMLIEVLYVPGCPNHEPAIRRLKKVLRSEALDLPVHEIPVNDDKAARSLRFPGSPTIRINGRDAEPGEPRTFGLYLSAVFGRRPAALGRNVATGNFCGQGIRR